MSVVALTAAEITEVFCYSYLHFLFFFSLSVTFCAFMILIRKSFIAIDQINEMKVELRTAVGTCDC